MVVSPGNTPETSPSDHRPSRTPTRRSSNLLPILGIGGGAFGAALVGVPICDNTHSDLLPFVIIGGLIGTVLPLAGTYAFIGAIIALFGPLLFGQQPPNMLLFLLPLLGAGIGVAQTFRAPQHVPTATVVAEERSSNALDAKPAAVQWGRVWLAVVSLVIAISLGVLAGFEPAGRGDTYHFHQCLVAGVTVGVVMFVGLVISAFMPTPGGRK